VEILLLGSGDPDTEGRMGQQCQEAAKSEVVDPNSKPGPACPQI